MSVLDRSQLEASPLADLHAIASELGIDSFRRLRKAQLIDAIIARQEGREPPAASDEPPEEEAQEEADEEDARDEERPRRPRRRGRRRSVADDGAAEGDGEGRGEPEPSETAEGVVELMGNGSAFLRMSPPDPSDDDVYVSAAQVRRCELVSGDRVAGPVRKPRRSERYSSLIRVETINGAPADEVARGTRYDDLPATFPTEHLALGGEDPTLQAIDSLTPIGKGSRVAIVGSARAGKSETLRRIAGALAGREGLEVTLVLAGVRPEETAEWQSGPIPPAETRSFAASGEAQAQVVEQAVELARRVAARGGDAVVLIDTIDGLTPSAARRAMAAARNIVDGGSLTIVATATRPFGGETTVIELDSEKAARREFPALDLGASGTLRPELLVGESGAEAIASARAEARAT